MRPWTPAPRMRVQLGNERIGNYELGVDPSLSNIKLIPHTECTAACYAEETDSNHG